MDLSNRLKNYKLREKAVKYAVAKLIQVGKKLPMEGYIYPNHDAICQALAFTIQNWLDQNVPIDWDQYSRDVEGGLTECDYGVDEYWNDDGHSVFPDMEYNRLNNTRSTSRPLDFPADHTPEMAQLRSKVDHRPGELYNLTSDALTNVIRLGLGWDSELTSRFTSVLHDGKPLKGDSLDYENLDLYEAVLGPMETVRLRNFIRNISQNSLSRRYLGKYSLILEKHSSLWTAEELSHELARELHWDEERRLNFLKLGVTVNNFSVPEARDAYNELLEIPIRAAIDDPIPDDTPEEGLQIIDFISALQVFHRGPHYHGKVHPDARTYLINHAVQILQQHLEMLTPGSQPQLPHELLLVRSGAEAAVAQGFVNPPNDTDMSGVHLGTQRHLLREINVRNNSGILKKYTKFAEEQFNKAEQLLVNFETVSSQANYAYEKAYRAKSFAASAAQMNVRLKPEDIRQMTLAQIAVLATKRTGLIDYYHIEFCKDAVNQLPLSGINFETEWQRENLTRMFANCDELRGIHNYSEYDSIINALVGMREEALNPNAPPFAKQSADMALAARVAADSAEQAADAAVAALINPVALDKFLKEQIKNLLERKPKFIDQKFTPLRPAGNGGKMSRRQYNKKKKSYNKFNRRLM